MRKITAFFLAICLLLSGCAAIPHHEEQPKRYTATFLELFDTVTTIVGFADSEEEFRTQTQRIHDELLVYHQLFDIYNDYEGVTNLKTVNDRAGIAPVEVSSEIIALLKDCRSYYELSGGRVNVAMGSVLSLWHVARNDGIRDPANATLPERTALERAADHMSFDSIVIDETASTVYIADPEVRLDVGAIAKGWATQRAAENAPKGMLISVGGNVCATGPKVTDGTPWVIGIQDPDDPNSNLHTVNVTGGSVVTSGDYQRTYWVDGKAYHHIIDPDTLMPASHWRSVTVVCADSGLADALSTALFLLPLEEGMELISKVGAAALWVDADGGEHMSPEFEKILRT